MVRRLPLPLVPGVRCTVPAPPSAYQHASGPGLFWGPVRGRFQGLFGGLCLAIWLVGTGCTESDRVADPVALPQPETTIGIVIEVPGWPGAASEIYTTDLDADGRPDLVLTSHLLNRVQPFRQQPSGAFEPLAPLEGVGFHPNGVVTYQDSNGARFLLQCAETRDELRIYQYQRGDLHFVGALPAPTPFAAAPLRDTDHADSVVVLSVGHANLTLLQGVDAKTASFSAQRTIRRPEGTDVGKIRSPINLRLGPGRDMELVFIDTLSPGSLRSLRFDEAGEPFFADVYALPWGYDPTLMVALQPAGEPDGGPPGETSPVLFLVGGADSPLRILWPRAAGEFDVRDVPLPVDGNDDMVLIDDPDEPPLLVISRQSQLVLLRFPRGMDAQPEWALIDKDPRFGHLMLAAADFDADGHTDLALANSGNRQKPPLVLRGPVWDHAAVLSEYYADAERFEPVLRPEDRALRGAPPVPGVRGLPFIPGLAPALR